MKTRSIGGPLILIAIGILWLLALTNNISISNLWALAHIVPFGLIAIGVSLLVRAVWHPGGIIISILIAAGVILAVLYAPQLGWDEPPSWAMNWDFGNNTGGRIAGSGNVVSETYTVKGFDTVEIDYPSQVVIRQGQTESLTIEADDNLLPQLNTKVQNGNLVIRNTESEWRDRVNPSEDVKITITVTDLSELQFSAAGKLNIEGLDVGDLNVNISGVTEVTIEDLSADHLDYQISGVGSTTADGEVQSLNLEMSGFGDFKGGDLAAQQADVQISGAGSATLWVTDKLDAEISGAGSLNYYGNPVVQRQISGAGTVNSKGDK